MPQSEMTKEQAKFVQDFIDAEVYRGPRSEPGSPAYSPSSPVEEVPTPLPRMNAVSKEDFTERMEAMDNTFFDDFSTGNSREDTHDILDSKRVPELVAKDREDRTEEICRRLAQAFYEHYGHNTLSKFTKRGELSAFYLRHYKDWCPFELTRYERHFKQVLFALCVDGKVCRVVGRVVMYKGKKHVINKGRFIKWHQERR